MDKIYVVIHTGYKRKWLFFKHYFWYSVSGAFENKEQALKQGKGAAKVFEGLIRPIDEKPYYLHIDTNIFECYLVKNKENNND